MRHITLWAVLPMEHVCCIPWFYQFVIINKSHSIIVLSFSVCFQVWWRCMCWSEKSRWAGWSLTVWHGSWSNIAWFVGYQVILFFHSYCSVSLNLSARWVWTLTGVCKSLIESAQWVDMLLFQGRLPFSGQRRLLQSGTAMKRHRNFLIVEGTRKGGLSPRHKEGWSFSKEQGVVSLHWGGLVVLPQENFQIQDVCRSDSYEFWGHFFVWKQAYFTSMPFLETMFSQNICFQWYHIHKIHTKSPYHRTPVQHCYPVRYLDRYSLCKSLGTKCP